ncbi:MAG: DUF1841 family protein [Proteobacteria bacterium]|nr:DUF1841 family protein [Burkholderiales bacterium]
MFQPSRTEARQFLIDAWRRHRAREVVSPLEAIAADVIAMHPEYHALLEQPAEAAALEARDYSPDDGAVNPFLHLHLHLAVIEQVSIDQPAGIAAAYARLLARLDAPLAAQHAIIDCLAETMWRAQRDQGPPDGEAYLACVERCTR